MARAHVDTAIGTLGGAPYGATKRVRGVPTLVARTHLDTAIGAFGGGSFLWGHEAYEGFSDMGGVD
eukprot:1652674-Pyramimonas_sp.AAC.1